MIVELLTVVWVIIRIWKWAPRQFSSGLSAGANYEYQSGGPPARWRRRTLRSDAERLKNSHVYVATVSSVMNILAYVQLRGIYGSTGAGRVARQMTEHLAKQSQDSLRILADPLDHAKVVRKVGVPWTNFSYSFFSDETSWQQARWMLTRKPVAEDYWSATQIVYCVNTAYIPTRKAPLVVTLHDAANFERGALPSNWRFRKQRLKSRYLYQTIARKADLVHVVSHFSAERIAYYFPAMQSRMRVVHNAVTPRFFLPTSPEGEEFLESLGLNDQPFIVLPGGLNHRKNAELVLRAWPLIRARHPHCSLVVAGHCDGKFAKAAESISGSAILTGFVSDEALCSLYHSAELVWFPSLYEGFGMPVLEAMACGTAVVTSNTTSLPEVAGDAGMLVSPSSVSDHVEAITSLLQDGRAREALAERGRARAQQFTWQTTAAQLRGHFAALV